MRAIGTLKRWSSAVFLGAVMTGCGVNPPRIQSVAVATPRDTGFVAGEILNGYLGRTGSPSVQGAAVSASGLLWVGSRGETAPGSKRPVDSTTTYRIASLTKVFTALAVFQLAAQGKIELDSSVTRILPDFKFQCPETHCSPITVRQLIVHASGLPRGELFVWHPLTGTALMEKLGNVTLAYPPGTRFSYSNLGYALLGEIVARVSHQEFRDYLREEILSPLGMHSTGFAPMDSALPNRALAAGIPNRHPLVQPLSDPEGGMYSNLSDLAKFTSWLLRGGRLPQYGDSAAPLLDSMVKPVRPALSLPENAKCGFGDLRINHSRPTPYKTGVIDGFSSGIFLDLEKRTGVVALSNRDLEIEELGFDLLDLFTGTRADSIGLDATPGQEFFRAESLQDLARFKGEYVLGIDYPVPFVSLNRNDRGLMTRFENKSIYTYGMEDGWASLRFTQAWDRQWLFFKKEYGVETPQLGFFSREGVNYVSRRGRSGVFLAAESPRTNRALDSIWETRAGNWKDASGYEVIVFKKFGRLFFRDMKMGTAWLLEPVSPDFARAGGPCRSQGLTFAWEGDGRIDYRMGIKLQNKGGRAR